MAFRNRHRRKQVPKEQQSQLVPKNLILIGSTGGRDAGSGKTELIRRLSEHTQSPFIKVEATQFTEIGYHGKDVESIVQDFFKKTSHEVKRELEAVKQQMQQDFPAFFDLLVLEVLLGRLPMPELRAQKLEEIRRGDYDARVVTVPKSLLMGFEAFHSYEQYFAHLRRLPRQINAGWEEDAPRVSLKALRMHLQAVLVENLPASFRDGAMAVRKIENEGIVFIDEIDKVVADRDSARSSKGVSTEGVQRDLLPIVEGTKLRVSGETLDTRHILFICAGAFSNCGVEDMMPEFLGALTRPLSAANPPGRAPQSRVQADPDRGRLRPGRAVQGDPEPRKRAPR